MIMFEEGDFIIDTVTGSVGIVLSVGHEYLYYTDSRRNGTYSAPIDQCELYLPKAKQADQWDEDVRGKKMSDATGKVIYKYQMPVLEHFTMKLPKDAEIIRMQDQGGMFWLWAIVDTDAPDEERSFYAFKCGGAIPKHLKLKYVGFCAVHVQMELGLYIFEEVK